MQHYWGFVVTSYNSRTQQNVEISDWTAPSVWQIDWSGPNTSLKKRRCDKSSVACDETWWFFDRKKVLEA